MPRRKSKPRTVICSICESSFLTTHSRGKYCSPDCAKKGEQTSWNKYGKRNRDKRQKYHSLYYHKNKEKILARTKEYANSLKGKMVRKKTDNNQKDQHPEKLAARTAVMMALRKGLLTKEKCPCGSKNVEAHHPDYYRPLEIVWLCRRCHLKEHELIRKQNKMINITTRMLDKLPAECRQISIHRDREDVYIVTNAGIFVPHDGRLVLLPEGPAFGITVKYEKE